jgi:hypothetical protein
MEDFGLEWRCRAVFDGDFILPHDPNRMIANDVEIAVSAFYSKKTEPSMKVSKLIAWEFPSLSYICWFKFKTCMGLPRDILVSRVLVAFSETLQEHGSVGIPEK